jgi:hypothetical protein
MSYWIYEERKLKMKENIAVLGRGSSLGKFKKFSHLFDTIYIVGNFYKEIKKLGTKHFKNKEIIHLVSRTDRPLRNNYYEKLNIVRIQTMYYPHQLKIIKPGKKNFMEKFRGFNIKFLPDYMKNRGYPTVSREKIKKYSKKFNNYKEMCIFFEKEYKMEIEDGIKKNNRSRYWPTTGTFALDLALVENNPKNLYIFGIDAYTAVSYVKYNWEPPGLRKDTHSLVSKLMIYHMEELAKEFYKINFNSGSDLIKINCSNWKII